MKADGSADSKHLGLRMRVCLQGGAEAGGGGGGMIVGVGGCGHGPAILHQSCFAIENKIDINIYIYICLCIFLFIVLYTYH